MIKHLLISQQIGKMETNLVLYIHSIKFLDGIYYVSIHQRNKVLFFFKHIFGNLTVRSKDLIVYEKEIQIFKKNSHVFKFIKF